MKTTCPNIFSYIIFLILLNSVSSCVPNGDDVLKWDHAFEEAEKLVSNSCLGEELILERPFLIQYADSSLIIYDDIGDSLFVLIDLENDNKVYRFGQKGEGDNEFLQVFAFSNMPSDPLIGFFDTYRHCLREINLR